MAQEGGAIRVLHLNSSFAGVPLVVRELRRLGIEADVATFDVRAMAIEADYLLPMGRRFTNGRRLFEFWRLARKYDILHFHYHSALPSTMNYADFPLWRLLGKKVVMHYRGDDLRGHRRLMPRLFANAIFVSTPDLLKWESRATWLPPARDFSHFEGIFNHNGSVRIVHAPSDRQVKGTSHILRAIEVLQREGVDCSLDLIENVPFSEVLERYRKADIVVDQLKVGWYGGAAIEGMSLGKPVLCYIRPDLEKLIPSDVLFSADEHNIAERLRTLLAWPELRLTLSRRGYEYARGIHDPHIIALSLAQTYQTLMAG